MINTQNGGLLLLPGVAASPSSPLTQEAARHAQFQFYAKPVFLQMMLCCLGNLGFYFGILFFPTSYFIKENGKPSLFPENKRRVKGNK